MMVRELWCATVACAISCKCAVLWWGLLASFNTTVGRNK